MANLSGCDPFQSPGLVHSRIKPGVSYLDAAVRAAPQISQECPPEQTLATKPVHGSIWPTNAQGSVRFGSSSGKQSGACQPTTAWKGVRRQGVEWPILDRRSSVRSEGGRQCCSPGLGPVAATVASKFQDVKLPEAHDHSRRPLGVTYREIVLRAAPLADQSVSGNVPVPSMGPAPPQICRTGAKQPSRKALQKPAEVVSTRASHGRVEGEAGPSTASPAAGTAESSANSEAQVCGALAQAAERSSSSPAAPTCSSSQEASAADRDATDRSNRQLSLAASWALPPSSAAVVTEQVDSEVSLPNSTFLPFHSLCPAPRGQSSGTFLPFHSLRLGTGAITAEGGDGAVAGPAAPLQASPLGGPSNSRQPSQPASRSEEATPLNSRARPFLPFPEDRSGVEIALEPTATCTLHRPGTHAAGFSTGPGPLRGSPPGAPRGPPPPPPPPPRAPPSRRHPSGPQPRARRPSSAGTPFTADRGPEMGPWPDRYSLGYQPPASSGGDGMLGQRPGMPYFTSGALPWSPPPFGCPFLPYVPAHDYPPYPRYYAPPYSRGGQYFRGGPYFPYGTEYYTYGGSLRPGRGVLAYGVSTGDHLPGGPRARGPAGAGSDPPPWRHRERAREARPGRRPWGQSETAERARPRLSQRAAEAIVRLGRERRRSALTESLLDSVPPYTYRAPRGAPAGGGEEEGGRPAVLCAICYEGIVDGDRVRALPCCHKYHDQCIVPWLEKKGRRATCPECIARVFQTPLPSLSSGDSTSIASLSS